MGSLEDLRSEYDREGMGSLLLELLGKVVWSTVRQYPSSDYSPDGTWDQMACEDVLHDWIDERLWTRGDLQAMLSSAATITQFRAALTTSLRQHLTNKRRRTIAGNLYKRVNSMLKTDPAFQQIGPASLKGEGRWTLSETPLSEPSPLSTRELTAVATELTDVQLQIVRYGPFSQKLSPILRAPQLRDFLIHLFVGARGSMTLTSVISVMQSRFALTVDEHFDLDEDIASSEPGPLDLATTGIRARSVISRLNNGDAHLVEMYFRANGDWEQAAERSGVSRRQLRGVVHSALEMICDCSDSVEDASAVLQSVESLLLQNGG